MMNRWIPFAMINTYIMLSYPHLKISTPQVLLAFMVTEEFD